MDFPVFHLDFIGNRVLIGIIAILHVLINHGLAVGAVPLIATLEWWGHRTGDRRWDELAYRVLFVAFIITTSVGALTGVGIWLSTSLVNPYAIGSLIRVFFWAWFSEWIVFVTEVCLLLLYFLSWKRMQGGHKRLHIAIGYVLAVFSWLTMAIIVAILGFMMDSGTWTASQTFLAGVFNPIYLPQLLFRTPTAMVFAGFCTLFMVYFFTVRNSAFRRRAVRFVSLWCLAWAPVGAVGAWVYWRVVPESMVGNLPVALGTQAFEDWHRQLGWLIVAATVGAVLTALWGLLAPRRLPRLALFVPALLGIWLLGYFERVREFIRKPDVIGFYQYANGILHDHYPVLQEQGLLAHATYVPFRTVTPENEVQAGMEVFRLACTRCHTTTGVNGIFQKFENLYGSAPWDPTVISNYIRNMHNTRYYMPPFPGNTAEREALTAWLLTLQERPTRLRGDQSRGVPVTAEPTAADPSGLYAVRPASIPASSEPRTSR